MDQDVIELRQCLLEIASLHLHTSTSSPSQVWVCVYSLLFEFHVPLRKSTATWGGWGGGGGGGPCLVFAAINLKDSPIEGSYVHKRLRWESICFRFLLRTAAPSPIARRLSFRFRKRLQRFRRLVDFFIVIVGNCEWIHASCEVSETVRDTFYNGGRPCRSHVRYSVNDAGPETCRERVCTAACAC